MSDVDATLDILLSSEPMKQKTAERRTASDVESLRSELVAEAPRHEKTGLAALAALTRQRRAEHILAQQDAAVRAGPDAVRQRLEDVQATGDASGQTSPGMTQSSRTRRLQALQDDERALDFYELNPEAAIFAADDESYLSTAWQIVRDFPQEAGEAALAASEGFQQGRLQKDLGRVNFDLMEARSSGFGAERIPELMAERARLKEELSKFATPDERDTFDKYISSTGQFIGQITKDITRAGVETLAVEAVVAGGTAATTAVVSGPLAPVTVPTATGAAVTATAPFVFTGLLAKEIWVSESGAMYDELVELGYDAEDPATMAGAHVYGATSTLVEMGSLKIFGKALSPVKDAAQVHIRGLLGKHAHSHLKQATRLQIARRAGQAIAAASLAEGGEEFVQTSVLSALGEAVASGGDLNDVITGTMERIPEAIEAFKLAAGGVFLGGAMARGASFGFEARAARRAEQEQAFFQAYSELASQSEMMQRSPKLAGEFLDFTLNQDQDRSTVWVERQPLADALEAGGFNLQEIEATLPGIQERIARAEETGGRVAMPAKEFGEVVAGTPVFESIKDHITSSPTGLTPAERKAEFEASEQAALNLERDKIQERSLIEDSADAATETMVNQIVASGRFTPAMAKQQAESFRARLVGFSQMLSRSQRRLITPEEALQLAPLAVLSQEESQAVEDAQILNQEGVRAAALQLPDGRMFIGKNHGEAFIAAEEQGATPDDGDFTEGFAVDRPDGSVEFVTRDEAAAMFGAAESQEMAEIQGRTDLGFDETTATPEEYDELYEAFNRLDEFRRQAQVLDQTPGQVEKTTGIGRILPFLEPDEQELLNDDFAEKLEDIFDELPPVEDIAAAAMAGKVKRGWYRRSAEAIVNIFGLDAPRFTAVLAATSPQTTVEMNLINSLQMFSAWVREGRPRDEKSIRRIMAENVLGNNLDDSVLDAWVNNTIAAFQVAEPMDLVLSGPKVDSFMRNLRDEVNRVTIDSWELLVFGQADPSLVAAKKRKGGDAAGRAEAYLAISARVRQVAGVLTELTGVQWTPEEVQETTWSWAKALVEKWRKMNRSVPLTQLLDDGAITDADIADTPDFAKLFAEGMYRQILEEGGYDVSTLESTEGRDGSDGGGADLQIPDAERGRFDRALRRMAERLDATDRERAAQKVRDRERKGLRTAPRYWKRVDAVAPRPVKNNPNRKTKGKPATWTLLGKAAKLLESRGYASDFKLIEPAPADFLEAITAAASAHKFGSSVEVKELADYEAPGVQLLMSPDGLSGIAVMPSGDITSAFNHPDAPGGRADGMLLAAIQAGGWRLDAFDTVLPEIYSRAGMRVVKRMKFNDEFAPDGWVYEDYAKFNDGRPDIVFMAYDPEHAKPYEPGEGDYTDDYDEGIAAQYELRKRLAEPASAIKAYKIVKTKKSRPGEIFPLFINAQTPIPIGEWIPGDNAPTKGFANRPGWHGGRLPIVPGQLKKKDGTLADDRVWVEVEFPADVGWQNEAESRPTGDIRNRLPDGGFYKWERPESQGGEWLIGGAMRVTRILTPEEVEEIAAGEPGTVYKLRKTKAEPRRRKPQDIRDTDAAVEAFNQGELAEQAGFHGGRTFEGRPSLEFNRTGEGINFFGYGLYFGNLVEIAEFYRAHLERQTSGRDRGQVIQAEIPDAEDLLVWDASFREQHPAVQEKLRALNMSEPVLEDMDTPGLKNLVLSIDANANVDFNESTGEPLVREEILEIAEFLRDDDRESWTEFFSNAFENNSGSGIYRSLEAQLGSKEAASAALNEVGIKGNDYPARADIDGADGRAYVIWDEDAIGEVTRLYQEEQAAPRAQIALRDNAAFIRLTEQTELTDFNHELAHWFLHQMVVAHKLGLLDTQATADLQTILDWTGAATVDDLLVPFEDGRLIPGTNKVDKPHEIFARGWEAHMATGVAPTPELQGIFRSFRRWVHHVYGGIRATLQRVGKDLTPEIREVYDRLFDAELAVGEVSGNFSAPLFTSAEAAGMTDAQFAAYQRAFENATERALDLVVKSRVSEVVKRKRGEAREERDRIRREVEKEHERDPAWIVIRWLKRDEPPFDAPGAPEAGVGLSRSFIEEIYGDAAPRVIELLNDRSQYGRGRPLVVAKNGIDPDGIAESFGFTSGRTMIDAMMAARTVEQKINGRVNQEIANAPYYSDEATLEEAHAVVANEDREKLLKAELRALRQALGGRLDAQARQQTAGEQTATPAESSAAVDSAQAELNEATRTGDEATIRAAQNAVLQAEAASRVAREQRRGDRAAGRRAAALELELDAGRIQARAAELVGDLPVGRMSIERRSWNGISVREGKKARRALAERNYGAALEAVERQLLAHFASAEVSRIEKEVRKGQTFTDRILKPKSLAKLRAPGFDGAAVVTALVDRYDMRKTRKSDPTKAPTKMERKLRAAMERTSRQQAFEGMLAFKQKAEENALVFDFAPFLANDNDVRHWTELSVSEYLGLIDTLRNVEGVTRQKARDIRTGKAIEIQEAAELVEARLRLLQATERKPTEKMLKARGISRDTIRQLIRQGDAALLKPEDMIDFMFGDEINNDGRAFIWEPINQGVERFRRLRDAWVDPMHEEIRKLDWSRLNKKVDIEGMNRTVYGYEILMMGLNWGTESNKFKLVEGYNRHREFGWDEDTFNRALAWLTPEEWDAIQGIWDLLNTRKVEIEGRETTLKDLIFDHEFEMTGRRPTAVNNRTFKTPAGKEMRGGYFPLVYDPSLDRVAKKIAEDMETKGMFGYSHVRAETSQGHLESRVEGFVAPILLDPTIMGTHLDRVLHDVALRKPISDTYRILNTKGVKDAMKDSWGDEYHEALNEWLRKVARVRSPGLERSLQISANISRWGRQGTTMVGLGYRIATGLLQLSGVLPIFPEVGWAATSYAIGRFMASPVDTVTHALETSNELADRARTRDRDLMEAIDQLKGKPRSYQAAQIHAFTFITWGDRIVSTIAWDAQYAASMQEHGDHQRAVREADRAIRRTQGGGDTKDNSILKNTDNELARWLTLFGSFASNLYARQRRIGRLATGRQAEADVDGVPLAKRNLPKAMSLWAGTVFLPAMLEAWMRDNGPPEDEEDPTRWALTHLAAFHLMPAPLVGESVIAAIEPSKRAFAGRSPVSRFFQPVYGIADAGTDFVVGEEVDGERLVRDTLALIGIGLHLPVGQLDIWVDNFWDQQRLQGPESPRDFIWRKPKE